MSRKKKTRVAPKALTHHQPESHAMPPAAPLPSEQLPPSEAVLSRADVAKALGISLSTVRRMEGHELHPVLRSGVNYFAPSEVDAVSRTIVRRQPGDGRLAAQIFLLLEEGLDLRQIVIRAQVPPPVVRVLYEEWCLPLEDWRQLSWSQKHRGQVPPPPTPRVEVAVADASGDATTVAVHADARHSAPPEHSAKHDSQLDAST